MSGRGRRHGVVIVTYHPPDELGERLREWGDVLVVVVDNTPRGGARAREWFMAAGAHEVIENGANLGVGRALNQGLDYLCKCGVSWGLVVDQDSVIGPGYLEKIGRYAQKESLGHNIALVGGVPSLGASQRARYLQHARRWAEVINSGTLVRVSAWREIGGYDEELFVDLVDFEFSRRLALRGFGVYLDEDATFEHRFGEPVPYRILGRTLFLNRYNPSRYYYRIRNGVYVATHKHRDLGAGWAVRRLAVVTRLLLGLPFLAIKEKAYLLAAASGGFHGLRGRLGPWVTAKGQWE